MQIPMRTLNAEFRAGTYDGGTAKSSKVLASLVRGRHKLSGDKSRAGKGALTLTSRNRDASKKISESVVISVLPEQIRPQS